MINKALEYYGFINPNAELIRHNENMTYKITDNEKCYVLRIHKPIEGFNLDFLRMGNNSSDLIKGEIELLLYFAEKGNLLTQKVKLNKYNDAVTIIEDKIPVTVLEWVDGKTLETIEMTETVAYETGLMLGKMHNELINTKFKNRYRYDETLISKMIEETSIAMSKGHFNEKHSKIITDTLSYMKIYFIDKSDKFILTHSDLSKSNLIYRNNTIIPIDFSLSGYCIPEMDLASVFVHIIYDKLNKIILDGYKSICKLKPDETGIDICYCFNILLFIVVQHNRIAGQPWLENKLDEWCENQFVPLINKKTISRDIDLYS